MERKRIVISSLGSAGDIHPFMAIALGLQARGHLAIFGTSSNHRQKIEGAGLTFVPVRPESIRSRTGAQVVEEASHPRWGSLIIDHRMLYPHARSTYEDLKALVRDADLLITSPSIAPAALVAAKTGVRWISASHAPLWLSPAGERLVGAVFPELRRQWPGSKLVNAAAGRLARPVARRLRQALRAVQRDEGIALPEEEVPCDHNSAKLVLGLFSAAYAPRQAEWRPQVRITGFPVFDGSGPRTELREDLARFLAEGAAPVVFALGSTFTEREFFRESLEAAVRVKCRALFLAGNHASSVLPEALPAGMMKVESYVPYSAVFPKAAAIIHHGGIGTTALALRSGRPMLVAPRATDQPDNAERARAAGVALVIQRGSYTASRAAAALRKLLDEEGYQRRSAEVARQVRAEDGVGAACEAVEEFLGEATVSRSGRRREFA